MFWLGSDYFLIIKTMVVCDWVMCNITACACVWFGPVQARWGMWSWSQANLWEQRDWLLSACLPGLYLCVSVHTLPPYLYCSTGAQHGIQLASTRPRTTSVLTHKSLLHMGKELPTCVLMIFTASAATDIISHTLRYIQKTWTSHLHTNICMFYQTYVDWRADPH